MLFSTHCYIFFLFRILKSNMCNHVVVCYFCWFVCLFGNQCFKNPDIKSCPYLFHFWFILLFGPYKEDQLGLAVAMNSNIV